MYTDILFDADDTLLDFQRAQLNSFRILLLHYKIDFSQEIYDIYTHINHEMWKRFEVGYISKERVQMERFSEFFRTLRKSVNGKEADMIYQRILEEQSWLMPYAEGVCQYLSEKYTLSIVTNGVGKTQKKRIASSAITTYIKYVIVSEDIGVAKPNRGFFEYVLALIKQPPKNILLIGDSLSSDIVGANNAGIDACWYNPYNHAINNRLNIKQTITNLLQLLDFI